MKRSISRALHLALALALSLAVSAAFSAPVAADPGATWDLGEGEQRLCYAADAPHSSYFVGFIAGHWDAPLVPEAQGFPAGTVISLASSVPPGDNGDRYIGTVWLGVDLPSLAYGDYHASLVVTDGTSTQTMPILIRAQDRWGC